MERGPKMRNEEKMIDADAEFEGLRVRIIVTQARSLKQMAFDAMTRLQF